MNTLHRLLLAAVLPMLFLGCGSSRQFVAIPATLDRAHVPTQTVTMTAERFHFTPEKVHVKAGTLVTISVTAEDGTHGFDLPAFGIDEEIPEGKTKSVEFYAQEKGEYPFHCSHFCGMGHPWMTGTIVVE